MMLPEKSRSKGAVSGAGFAEGHDPKDCLPRGCRSVRKDGRLARRAQLVLMSRLEAIRQLVSMVLDAAENGKTKRGN